jgi:threonine/homoserine/homoserine lactone efflux protein
VIRSLLAFAAFAAVVTITPGLDTMLVVRTAVARGRRSAFAAGSGVCLGVLCWAVAGALGITALLTASRIGYDVLRWVGAAYLVGLGVRLLWRSRRSSTVDGSPPPRSGPFTTGLANNLLNPKVGVFYLAVLPQFLPHGVPPLLASTTMALVHAAEGMLWFSLIIFLVTRSAQLLSRPDIKRRLDQVTGLVFVGFGVRLAASRL